MLSKLIELLISNLKWVTKSLKKIRYRILPLNFDIAISIKSEEGLNSGQYYKQLNKDFIKLLNDHNLTSKLRIKNITDIISFDNNERALEFVKKKNLNLLIWGEFSVDNLKQKGENVNDINLHFTYLHPEDICGLLGQSINDDISSKNKLKGDWKIHENNSSVEVRIISKNIFDISIYTIALTLKFFQHWMLSAELLENLYKNATDDKQFKNAIAFHLINCYDLISLYYINEKKDYNQSEKYLYKLLDLDPMNYLVKSNLALCKFKNGDIKSAEKLIEDAYIQNPNHPTCQLNYAYLSIRKKDYKKAYRMYQKFFDYSVVPFEPLDVIDFLNKEFEVMKDPALLYGSAMMNYIYKDRAFGIKDFKTFLKKADEKTMEDMIKKANQLIK